MTIDDLAHTAELEAEVLRAVSHLSPAAAQEFLMSIILKIRRASGPRREPVLPKLLASTIVEQRPKAEPVASTTTIKPLEAVEAPSYVRGTRTKDVVNLVRTRGEMSAGDIKTALAGSNGLERGRVHSTIYHLVERGVLRRVGDMFSLATLDPPDVKEVG